MAPATMWPAVFQAAPELGREGRRKSIMTHTAVRVAMCGSLYGRRRQMAAHEGCGEGCWAFVRLAAAHGLRRGVWIILPLHAKCHGGRGELVMLLADVTVQHVSHERSSEDREA